jgi:hypothetical protein
MNEDMGRGKGISKREKIPIRKKKTKSEEGKIFFFLPTLFCFFLFLTTKKESRI